jgi:hypothetical protein
VSFLAISAGYVRSSNILRGNDDWSNDDFCEHLTTIVTSIFVVKQLLKHSILYFYQKGKPTPREKRLSASHRVETIGRTRCLEPIPDEEILVFSRLSVLPGDG